MMKVNVLNIQDTIMSRKDCQEELRNFFDEKLQGMYSADYNLKFSSQTNDAHYKKEQRMMELIRSATVTGDKEKLKMLQEYGESNISDGSSWFTKPNLRSASSFSG